VVLSLDDESWLGDRKVQQDVIFPLAGYVAMAREAIRQIAGIEAGYSMRPLMAHSAVVLGDSKPVEIVTTLRRHKLTDSIDSDFYDFVISSYSGSVWIKNCEGRVKANGKFITTTTSPETLPRHVPVSRWYETLSRVGHYDPEFQGLTRITSSTTDCLAAAKVLNLKTCQEGPFLFHSAATDACFQLGIVAMGKGAGRSFTQLCVPRMIEELDVSRSALEMSAQAWISADGKEIGMDCVTEGVVALRLRSTQAHIFPGYVAMMNNCSAPFVNGLHSQLGRSILPLRCLASFQRFN
jgi:acyl transferase domain-containing protein